MHDWTRVSAGTYHDFHNSWITHIKEALNGGLLPPVYYALGEQRAGDFGPDVLALKASEEDNVSETPSSFSAVEDTPGLVALATAPPQVQTSQEAIEDVLFYLERQRSVTIRHATGDRIVALIEIVSPANRHGRKAVEDFADKVIASLRDGIHVVVIDPFPGSINDPDGFHDFIWRRIWAGTFRSDIGKPLTMVSYSAGRPIKAWIEPYAVGDVLTAMPLFLTNDHYILLPLEATYNQSWSGVPTRWKRVIEAQM